MQKLRQFFERLALEFVSRSDLYEVERFVDTYFHKIGLDLEFTQHFLDRVNDPRNGKEITPEELTQIFTRAYQKLPQLRQLTPDQEAVLNDTRTFLNVPFVIKYDKRSKGLMMIAKTVMRKPRFTSPDTIYKV
jgi:uncharacterized protein (UPF0305 family)